MLLKYRRMVYVLVIGVVLSLSAIGLAQNPQISGLIFNNYTYQTNTGQNSFNIDRVYLNFRGSLSEQFNYRVTTDASAGNNGYELFLKYTYLQWNPERCDDLGVMFGLTRTNAFHIQEDTWGLRYLYKNVMDHYGIASSAELGVRVDKGVGNDISLSGMISNGEGFNSPEVNKYKQFSLRGVYGSKDLSGSGGMNAGGYFSYEPVSGTRSSFTYELFAGYSSNQFAGGAEVGQYLVTDPTFTPTFLSFYGRYEIVDQSMIFLRTDFLDSDATNQSTIIAGLQYKPVAALSIAPNIVYTMNENIADMLLLRGNFEIRF